MQSIWSRIKIWCKILTTRGTIQTIFKPQSSINIVNHSPAPALQLQCLKVNWTETIQASPSNLVPGHGYQLSQPFLIFPSNQSSLIVLKNDSMDSKPSSYNSSNDNCLNRSFEKNFAAYSNFDSPLFNVQQAQMYPSTIQNPSPQLFYQQKSTSGYFYNSPESNPVSGSPFFFFAFKRLKHRLKNKIY